MDVMAASFQPLATFCDTKGRNQELWLRQSALAVVLSSRVPRRGISMLRKANARELGETHQVVEIRNRQEA
jgi:hypothetical protein